MARLVNKIDMVLVIMMIMNLMSKSARHTSFLSLFHIYISRGMIK